MIIRFITLPLPWHELGTKKKEKPGAGAYDRRQQLAGTDPHRRSPPLDPRPPRRHPRGRNLAAKQKSARTRRAYRLDVQHFMRTLGITTPDELRQADHQAVIAWERYHARDRARRAVDDPPAAVGAVLPVSSTWSGTAMPRKTRSARSSGRRSIATKAPPSPSRRRRRANCSTRRPRTRSQGLRDRAILSVGLQVGLAPRRDRRTQGRRSAPEPRL